VRIGLFGGSFDPIHHAHLLAAQAAAEQLGLEQVRFVPAREQPFKQGRHAAAAEHRAAMVARAIEGTPGFALEREEMGHPGVFYPVDNPRALQARAPEAELVLLLGADAAADLDSWHEADQISELARIAVFARPGATMPRLPEGARTVTIPAMDLSATEIRRRVRAGRTIRYWVPDAVAEYIAAHRLYRDGEG
jgi:nicotinate-nucleotide adenylyltransferase